MKTDVLKAIIGKEFSLFFRNIFFALMSIIVLVIYLAIYFVLPAETEDDFKVGLYAEVPVIELLDEFEHLNTGVVMADTPEVPKLLVENGDVPGGIILTKEDWTKVKAGEKMSMDVYVAPSTPGELANALAVITEMAMNDAGYQLQAKPLDIDVEETIMGFDLLGEEIPMRDRLLPLIAVFILMTETMALANLILEEMSKKTINAVLMTPVTLNQLFVGKGFTGITLAFLQALLVTLITGSLLNNPLIILVTLLLGAVLVTGLAFLIATVAKDMMSLIAWGILFLLLLSIPCFGVMFPGMSSDWVKIVPSFYMIDTIHKAANFGAGWGEIAFNLAALTGFCVATFWLGTTLLRRKLTCQ